jgi:hypothetical protein
MRVDRVVLLAQGDHALAYRTFARLGLRPSCGLLKERATIHFVSEAPAQIAEGAGLVAEPAGGFGRGHPLDEVGAQRLVLAMSGLGGLQEEAGLGCQCLGCSGHEPALCNPSDPVKTSESKNQRSTANFPPDPGERKKSLIRRKTQSNYEN